MSVEVLIEKVTSAHLKQHGKPSTKTSLAPGRVNLMGEHTDYNDGLVLPAAIDFFTCVSGSLSGNDIVSVIALDFENDVDQFDIEGDILSVSVGTWKNYIRGAFHILKKEGHPVHGCELTISGNIPKAAGLSSSASLEVAVLNTLSELFSLKLDKKTIARIGQIIENEFIGLSCGIMDQLSAACGQKEHAIMIDCFDYEITPVSMPGTLSIMIINSNVKRQLTTIGYNDRRIECEKAADLFDVKSLRDVSYKVFLERKDDIPELIAKRAEHVICENQRVVKLSTALKSGSLDQISKLMNESHKSMNKLFEITTPEIDFLVDLIDDVIKGEGGVRMTGGGFGGCVIALLPPKLINDVQEAIDRRYKEQTGLLSTTYLCQPSDGVKTIDAKMKQ